MSERGTYGSGRYGYDLYGFASVQDITLVSLTEIVRPFAVREIRRPMTITERSRVVTIKEHP